MLQIILVGGSFYGNGFATSVGNHMNVNNGGQMTLIGGNMSVHNNAYIAGNFTVRDATTAIGNNMNIRNGGSAQSYTWWIIKFLVI